MKRVDETEAVQPNELNQGGVKTSGELAEPVRRPRIMLEPPKNKVRHVTKLKIAKINPYRRQRAVISIDANMSEIRRVVGSKHVGTHLVCNIDDTWPIHVCCDNELAAGPIWRVGDEGLPIRGSAILYANFGHGPADFPVGPDWLQEMIQWEPEGVTKAINDPIEEGPSSEKS